MFFFWTLIKCYLLLAVSSDVLRFAYLLGRDAWRPDTFEAYRRLLVSDAWREVDEGEFYNHSWSCCLTNCQKTWDVIFQCWLHFTFDIVPCAVFILSLASDKVSKVFACQVCLGIGIFHILVFYFLWLFGEVTLKIFYFRRAWVTARTENSSRPTRPTRTAALYTGTVWGTLNLNGHRGDSSTESRSICVLLCTIFHWMEYLMPMLLGLLLMIAGLVFQHDNVAICGGLFFGLSSTIMVFARTRRADTSEDPSEEASETSESKCHWGQYWGQPNALLAWFPNAEALQQWGERWCRLGYDSQRRQRYQFLLMVALSSTVFGAFNFRGLAVACLVLVLLVFIRLLWLRVEGSMGWLWATVETFVELVLLTVLITVTGKAAKTALQDAAVVLVLYVMRQFGFQREIWCGERVRLAASIILGFVHLFFVILVCFAVASFWEDQDWSAFGQDISKTKFYSIPTFPPFQFSNSTLPLCLLRFPVGEDVNENIDSLLVPSRGQPANVHYPTGGPPSLSLMDFALMASLTYENPKRFEWGCKHYFPHWRVEKQPENARAMDWIRFLMLTSADNSTTVIAVRGTLDFLDVLQDVALWCVPALMQALNFVGPDVSSGAWGQAISGLSRLIPLSSVNPDRAFSSVLSATEYMMTKYPKRLFYLTGHSLGGGVAKLVALKLSSSLKVPLTVAFSAPGVHHAARVLLGKLGGEFHDKLEQESMTTITVKPMHDLISRIDLDTGNSVVAPCMGRPYQCHSVYRTLWNVFKICGSMTHSNLTVPCGWSSQAPC